MKQVIILKGLPASGKSTYAKKLIDDNPGRYKRINKDDLRAMLDNSHWSKGNEKFVIKMRDLMIEEALKNGNHVIVDDTNLHPSHEVRVTQVAQDTCGQAVRVKVVSFLDVSVEECIKRDQRRENSVGKKVIMDMYNKFLRPDPVDVIPPERDPNLPDCLICDLDGTLALGMHHRSPYEWHKVGDDLIDPAVEAIVRKFYDDENYHVIFMTGRDGCCARETGDWLERHGFATNIPGERDVQAFLYHRTAGDTRKDSIVKRELYEKHIKGKYNVLFVLDDRDQVVEMWRNELGLKCLQVAEGKF